MWEGIQHLYQVFLDILFPKKCLICNKVFNLFLCEKCFLHLKACITLHTITSFDLDALYSLFNYSTELRLIVHLFKYAYVQELGEIIFSQFHDSFFNETGCPNLLFDCIVPIPLHDKRFCERGFNQSEILAQQLGEIFDMPVRTDLLKRIRNTKHQARLNKSRRIQNIQHAFIVLKHKNVPNSILLVDDVYTTGTTMCECARILKQSGVKTVFGIVLYKKDSDM